MELIPGDRAAVPMRGQFARPLVAAVDDGDLMRSFLAQIAERFRGHFAGADHDHVLVVESFENLPAEIGHGHAGYAHPPLVDGRFACHPRATCKAA